MAKKKKSPLTLFYLIFLIVGIALLVAGIVVLHSELRFQKNAVKIQAVITDIQTYRGREETRHAVFVEYEYDGEIYKDIRLNEYNNRMSRGKKVTILVDPEDPQRISTEFGTILAGGMIILMGVIFSCVAIIPFILGIKKSSQQKQLIAGGRSIFAKVESITQNKSYKVNGRSPYIVYCTYEDEYKGVVYRFKSANIWENPEYCIQPGSDIRVYVNGEDFSKYYVDVESMIENRVIDYT